MLVSSLSVPTLLLPFDFVAIDGKVLGSEADRGADVGLFFAEALPLLPGVEVAFGVAGVTAIPRGRGGLEPDAFVSDVAVEQLEAASGARDPPAGPEACGNSLRGM